MSNDKKSRLEVVVSRMAELRGIRKTHLDAYNATSAETDTLRAERTSLEAEVAAEKAQAAKEKAEAKAKAAAEKASKATETVPA